MNMGSRETHKPSHSPSPSPYPQPFISPSQSPSSFHLAPPRPHSHLYRGSPTPSLTHSVSTLSSRTSSTSISSRSSPSSIRSFVGNPLPSHLINLPKPRHVRFGDGWRLEEVEESAVGVGVEGFVGGEEMNRPKRRHLRFDEDYGITSQETHGVSHGRSGRREYQQLQNEPSSVEADVNDTSALNTSALGGAGSGVGVKGVKYTGIVASHGGPVGHGVLGVAHEGTAISPATPRGAGAAESGARYRAGARTNGVKGYGNVEVGESGVGGGELEESDRAGKKRKLDEPKKKKKERVIDTGTGSAPTNTRSSPSSLSPPIDPSNTSSSPQQSADKIITTPSGPELPESSQFPFTFCPPSLSTSSPFTIPQIILIEATSSPSSIGPGSSSSLSPVATINSTPSTSTSSALLKRRPLASGTGSNRGGHSDASVHTVLDSTSTYHGASGISPGASDFNLPTGGDYRPVASGATLSGGGGKAEGQEVIGSRHEVRDSGWAGGLESGWASRAAHLEKATSRTEEPPSGSTNTPFGYDIRHTPSPNSDFRSVNGGAVVVSHDSVATSPSQGGEANLLSAVGVSPTAIPAGGSARNKSNGGQTLAEKLKSLNPNLPADPKNRADSAAGSSPHRIRSRRRRNGTAGVASTGAATPGSGANGGGHPQLSASGLQNTSLTPTSPPHGASVKTTKRRRLASTGAMNPVASSSAVRGTALAPTPGGTSGTTVSPSPSASSRSGSVPHTPTQATILGKRKAPTGVHPLADKSKYNGSTEYHYPCIRSRSLSHPIPRGGTTGVLSGTVMYRYRLFCTTSGKQLSTTDPSQGLLWWDLLTAEEVEAASLVVEVGETMAGWNRIEGSQVGDRMRWALHRYAPGGVHTSSSQRTFSFEERTEYERRTETLLDRKPELLPLLTHRKIDRRDHKTCFVVCGGRSNLGHRWDVSFGQGFRPSADLDEPLLHVLLDLDRVAKSDEIYTSTLQVVGIHRNFVRQVMLGLSFWWETAGDRLIHWLLSEADLAAKVWNLPRLQNRDELDWGGQMWSALHRAGVTDGFRKGHTGMTWQADSVWSGHAANSVVEYLVAGAFFGIYNDGALDWRDMGLDVVVRAANAVGMAYDGFPSSIRLISPELLRSHVPPSANDVFDWKIAVSELEHENFISADVAMMVEDRHEPLWRPLWGVVGQGGYELQEILGKHGSGLIRTYCRCYLAGDPNANRLRTDQGAITHHSDAILRASTVVAALKHSGIESTLAFQEWLRRSGGANSDLCLQRFYNRLVAITMFAADRQSRTLRPITQPFQKVLGPIVALRQRNAGGT